jgi:hypothetical protein
MSLKWKEKLASTIRGPRQTPPRPKDANGFDQYSAFNSYHKELIQTTFLMFHRRVLSFGSPIRPHSASSQGLQRNHTKKLLGLSVAVGWGAPPAATRRMTL